MATTREEKIQMVELMKGRYIEILAEYGGLMPIIFAANQDWPVKTLMELHGLATSIASTCGVLYDGNHLDCEMWDDIEFRVGRYVRDHSNYPFN